MFCGHCGTQLAPNAIACVRCGAPPRTGRAFCTNCGKPNEHPQAIMCTQCGAPLGYGAPPPPPPGVSYGGPVLGTDIINPSYPPKEPILMAVLSFLIAGLGQMILGQVAKGATILALAIVVALVTCGWGAPVVWVVAVVDAYIIADKLKRGQPVRQWEWF